jgi:multidrug efflux pump subunit AcrA (membrane-fusion protein)
MAEHDLTRTQIVEAQVQQSDAQLALVNDQLAHARIVAPFDGVVISGDLSQLIGSPVELGKKLFEIAPLHDYRVILQVDESEIRHVHVQQHGRLMVTGLASDPLPLVVTKMTPVSTAKDGANYFRVEASLDHAPANLRPGMEGIGKIEVGERRLWWVATHTLTDWIQLKLWQWLP